MNVMVDVSSRDLHGSYFSQHKKTGTYLRTLYRASKHSLVTLKWTLFPQSMYPRPTQTELANPARRRGNPPLCSAVFIQVALTTSSLLEQQNWRHCSASSACIAVEETECRNESLLSELGAFLVVHCFSLKEHCGGVQFP